MKNLILFLSFTFISFTSHAQVANRLFNPQAAQLDTNAYNVLWIDTTAGNQNRILVARSTSLKIIPKQIKWGVDTMTALRTTLNTKLAKSDTTGKWRPSTWNPAWSDVSSKPSFAAVATSGSYTDLSSKPDLSIYYLNSNPAGYISSVPAQSFASLTGKPTTLAGYGITDAYPLSGNPSSFITASSSSILTNKSGNISQWTNDSGFLTSSTGTPSTRTITINGTSQDLAANRTWTVGDVSASGSYSNPTWITSLSYGKLTGAPTNVSSFTNDAGYITSSSTNTLTNKSGNISQWTNDALYVTTSGARAAISAGTGIGYNAGSGVVTNTAPDQTVTLTAGSGVSVIGTYPGFTISAVIPASTNTSSYAAGTPYTLTTSSAKITFGTTSPSVTLGSAGTYLILTNLKIEYAGLTTLLTTNATFKLRRINNTAGDLANASTVFNIPVVTLLTQTAGDVDIAPIVYTTANSGDTIEMWGNRGTNVTVGSVQVGEASLVAIKLY